MNLRQRVNLLFFGAVGLAASFLSPAQAHASDDCMTEAFTRLDAIWACVDMSTTYECYACLGESAFIDADKAFRECDGPSTPLVSPGLECDNLAPNPWDESGSGDSGCSGESGESGC